MSLRTSYLKLNWRVMTQATNKELFLRLALMPANPLLKSPYSKSPHVGPTFISTLRDTASAIAAGISSCTIAFICAIS